MPKKRSAFTDAQLGEIRSIIAHVDAVRRELLNSRDEVAPTMHFGLTDQFEHLLVPDTTPPTGSCAKYRAMQESVAAIGPYVGQGAAYVVGTAWTACTVTWCNPSRTKIITQDDASVRPRTRGPDSGQQQHLFKRNARGEYRPWSLRATGQWKAVGNRSGSRGMTLVLGARRM